LSSKVSIFGCQRTFCGRVKRVFFPCREITNNGEKFMISCLEPFADELSADMEQEWLRNAAYEGYVPAMYDYGLSCSNPKQRTHRLRMAAC
jgi:hypothetical protein